MPYIGNIVQDFSVNNAMLNTDSVTSIKIDDGTIVNADINDSAAIAGSKISPSFTSALITNAATGSAASANQAVFDYNTSDTRILSYNSSGSSINLFTNTNGGSLTSRLAINSSGDVGIGESSSIDARLHVNSGTNNATLFLESTDGDVNLCMADNAGSCRLLQSAGDLHFRTGGNANAFGTGDSERMVIDSSGNVGIGTSTVDNRLHIESSSNTYLQIEKTGTSSKVYVGNASGGAIVESSGGTVSLKPNSAANKFILDTSGRMLLGISTARENFGNNTSGVAQQIQLEGTSAITSSMSLIRNSNDVNDGGIIVGKTRGTSVGSNTVVQAGDDLGNISFVGADGTTMQFGADIKATVESGVGNDDMPAALVFSTNSGTTSTTERMRIDSSGRLNIGTDLSDSTMASVAGLVNIHTTNTGTHNSLTLFWDHNNLTTDIEQRIQFSLGDNASDDQYVNAGYIAIGKANTWQGNSVRSSYLSFATSNAATQAERMRLDSSGRLLIGTSTSKSTSAGQYGLLNIQGGVGTTENFVAFSRNEAASAMSVDDEVSNLTFTDSVGYEFARIKVLADAATGTADTPGRLVFLTTPDGGSGAQERLRIDKDGNVSIGIAGTTNRFHVEGTTTGSRFGVDTSSSGIASIVATNESNADVELVIYDGRSAIGSSVNIPIAFHTNGKTNERMRLTTSGELLVGMSNSQAVAGASSKIQVQSNDSTGRISIVQHRNEAEGAPFLSLGKTRATGTNNSTLVQDGDTLGTIAFAGGDGTDIQTPAAQIVCQVDNTPGSNDMPGRLLFKTTHDGGSATTERYRITNSGNLGWRNQAVYQRKAFFFVGQSGGTSLDTKISGNFENNDMLRVQYAFNWNAGDGGAWGTAIVWKQYEGTVRVRQLGEELASPADSVSFPHSGNDIWLRFTLSANSGMNGYAYISVEAGGCEPFPF